MALTDKLTNIADAIRGKTGKTEEMTLDQMATEIAGIQAGGGSGSMESGECICTSNYIISIPISSKKSHVVIVPKVFEDPTFNTGRIGYYFGIEAWGLVAVRPGNKAGYQVEANSMPLKFTDSLIEITSAISGVPLNKGNYIWFAW